ncbi:phosphate acyltransferase PlsX [Mycoplasma struthionis]|uniref:Phosphate acyltransferase n=1 Tax=Mycoplasma struthionis TaxID=538220 RepID=A0A3G8LFW7_9MOLU|nr:phosphate acyltransferase PlsX [Mycoplasma struthionis]AZG68539.1 phosphate acyltransferase PlsX [Mycoplasma struthionis]
MKTIVFDLLNVDNGELEAIKAAKEFLKENKDYYLYLVGNQELIKKELKGFENQIEIINSDKIAHKVLSVRDALKEESSMLTAFEILNEKADAILSSGDSGSFITLSTLKVKRLPGISRPAFMPIMPSSQENNFLLLDAGANIDIKANYLVEWASVAKEYFEILFNKKRPKVAILNIGTEDYKGKEEHKEANEILKANNQDFDYLGFVEPKNPLNGEVDILLADGYAGNIFLKTMESSFLGVAKRLKKMLLRNFKTKIAALILKKDLKAFKKRYDYRYVGGAYIIGLNKVVVKAHGSSDALAFYSALNQIKIALDHDLINKLNKEE